MVVSAMFVEKPANNTRLPFALVVLVPVLITVQEQTLSFLHAQKTSVIKHIIAITFFMFLSICTKIK